MNLVIKNTNETAPLGAEKVYKDALVSEGTLMLIDFSNRRSTIDYDLEKGVFDLAGDAAKELNVNTDPEVALDLPIEITPDRGLPGSPTGAAGNNDFTKGVLFKNIGKYLFDNQPKSIVSFWLKLDMSAPNIAAGLMVRSQDVGSAGNITLQAGSAVNPTLSVRFADKISLANRNIGTDYIQVAVEFTGPTTANKVYINGSYDSDGTTTSGGFVENSLEDILRLGQPSGVASNPITLYRMLIEDLDVSGRSAQQVVTKDYNYVNALGEYTGIQKRPYANVA